MARHGINIISKPVILSIENSSMCGSVAIVSKNNCICEYSLSSNVTHSQRLIAAIDLVMNESSVGWHDIDAVAVSLGPGSFTGLRIGLSTAKGLVMAASKKLIGVNTLDGLALQLAGASELICPIIDARKKEVYAAFYRCDDSNVPRQEGETISVCPHKLAESINEPVRFIGDGCVLYQKILENKLARLAKFASTEIFYPRASSIGMAAIEKYHMGDFLNPISASPVYIRPSDAEMISKKN